MSSRDGAGGAARAGKPPSPSPYLRAVFQGQGPVIAVVALGGAIGASGRYGAGLLLPTGAGDFPSTTLGINVLGCLLIGVLMVVITEGRAVHRLARPFLGTGVLGGFTTFSTYAVDIRQLVGTGRAPLALAYLAATVLAALAAVWTGSAVTRRLLAARRRR